MRFLPKFFRIFKHEYRRHVLRKRFLIALLSVPLWLVFAVGLALVSLLLQSDTRPVGFVDPGGVIQVERVPGASNAPFVPNHFQGFESIPAARAALEAGEIQAYFELPPDYPENRDVRLVYLEPPGDAVVGQFAALARYNLLLDLPEDRARRIHDGPSLSIEAIQAGRQSSRMEGLNIVAPVMLGIFLMGAIFTSGGYLMQAVVEEKENRTMEILVTSASPGQIMNGKIAALIAVGLTQLAAWALPPVGILALASRAIPQLEAFALDRGMLLLALVTGVPTFVLVAALMATLGATVAEAREGQQVIGMISLVVMAPYFLAFTMVGNPHGVIATALSFFPLTASQTMLIRVGIASVPPWQVALSAGIVTVFAAGALWLSGRAFRLGMLRYGQRVRLRDILPFLARLRRKQGAKQEVQA